MIDVLQHDGLRDPFGKYLMGVIAEKTAEKHNITRQDQDQYAQLSYTRSLKAQKEGTFSPEIVPVEVRSSPSNQEDSNLDLKFSSLSFSSLLAPDSRQRPCWKMRCLAP